MNMIPSKKPLELERSIYFTAESLVTPWLDEIIGLSSAHAKEVVPFDDFKIDVKRQHYQAADVAGILRTFLVRDSDKIVGYAVFIVSEHPHFQGIKSAVQDLIYLKEEYRVGNIGREFIDFCEAELCKDECDIVYQFTGLKRDLSKLFEDMGYEKIQKVYAKRFKKLEVI